MKQALVTGASRGIGAAATKGGLSSAALSLGRPSEVAHVIRYLCSEESGCLTGQVVHVDGGMSPQRS